MYNWEEPFNQIVRKTRRSELVYIVKTLIIRSIRASMLVSMSKLATFICLVHFILSGNEIKPASIFVVVAIFNQLRFSLINHLTIGKLFLKTMW